MIRDADGDRDDARLSVKVSPDDDRPIINNPSTVLSKESDLSTTNVIEVRLLQTLARMVLEHSVRHKMGCSVQMDQCQVER